MRYIIIDDEPIAHSLITKFALDIPYMINLGSFYNAIDALPILKEQEIDLIFLDMNMPKIKGFDFLRGLSNPPEIIVITAHREFAIEGYEYDITDYLLKPFNFERFFKAVQKVHQKTTEPKSTITPQNEYIFIKDEKKHHKVKLSDIKYIEASGNYAMVYLMNDRIMTQMKISDFEKLLPKDQFTRIHRSYVISKQFITLIKSAEIHLGDITLPVGRVYKDNIQGLMD